MGDPARGADEMSGELAVTYDGHVSVVVLRGSCPAGVVAGALLGVQSLQRGPVIMQVDETAPTVANIRSLCDGLAKASALGVDVRLVAGTPRVRWLLVPALGRRPVFGSVEEAIAMCGPGAVDAPVGESD